MGEGAFRYANFGCIKKRSTKFVGGYFEKDGLKSMNCAFEVFYPGRYTA